jgi:hypothetical protein
MSDKEEDVSPYLRRPGRSYAEVLRKRVQRSGRCTKATEQSGPTPNESNLTDAADANNGA